MELTNNLLDKISAKVIEITRSPTLTQNKLDVELKSVEKDITKIKSVIKQLTEDLLDHNLVSDKIIELEDIILQGIFSKE